MEEATVVFNVIDVIEPENKWAISHQSPYSLVFKPPHAASRIETK